MYKGRRILALVPARGGSKGLPGKNIRPLGGKPLLAWSIEAARQSPYIDRCVLSTDCETIAAAGRAAGAQVPFMRPAELATDTAASMDVFLHALAQNGEEFDLLLVLQPTSPLRTGADIDAALDLYAQRDATAVVSVCPVDHHPWLSNVLPADGCMSTFLRPEVASSRRQDLPAHYRINGALYLSDVRTLRETRTFYGPRTYALQMPPERSVDIDSLYDFRLAEACLASANPDAGVK